MLKNDIVEVVEQQTGQTGDWWTVVCVGRSDGMVVLGLKIYADLKKGDGSTCRMWTNQLKKVGEEIHE